MQPFAGRLEHATAVGPDGRALPLVVEHGRITQAGTHKELMREPGHYRHIAEVQLAYQEKEILAKAEKKAEVAALKQ